MVSAWIVAFDDKESGPNFLTEVFENFDDAVEEVVSMQKDGTVACVVQIVIDPLFPKDGEKAVKEAVKGGFQTCLRCHETLPGALFRESIFEGVCDGCAIEAMQGGS